MTERPRQREGVIAAEIVGRSNLAGFVDIEFMGLRPKKLPVIRGPTGTFVALRSVPILDKTGRQKRDSTGKGLFAPICEWTDPDIALHFQAAVIGLLERDWPALLADYHENQIGGGPLDPSHQLDGPPP